MVFALIMLIRRYKTFDGMLALAYTGLYGLARFIAEFYRAPDVQIGYIFGTNWLTMGQALSILMMVLGALGYWYLKTYYEKRPQLQKLAPKASETIKKAKKKKK